MFPSGQRGQTVNLLSTTSVVRIHPLPPKITNRFCGWLFLCKKGWMRTTSLKIGGLRSKRTPSEARVHPLPPKTTNRFCGWLFLCKKGWIRTTSLKIGGLRSKRTPSEARVHPLPPRRHVLCIVRDGFFIGKAIPHSRRRSSFPKQVTLKSPVRL